MATSPRIDHANELRAQLEQIMTADPDLASVIVSLDPLDIPSGIRNGIVIISPPDLEFPAYWQTDVQSELAVIAGPTDNLLAAWTRLDQIVEAIRTSPIPVLTARGDMFKTKSGESVPGYTLTMTADTLIDTESEVTP